MILRRLVAGWAAGSGAGGASDFFVDQIPILLSEEPDRIREEGAWTAMLSMTEVWPMSSKFGVKLPLPVAASSYFHIVTDLSLPALTMEVGDSHLAAWMEPLCQSLLEAITSWLSFQMLILPSNEAERMRFGRSAVMFAHVAALEDLDSTSTEEIQSSCS